MMNRNNSPYLNESAGTPSAIDCIAAARSARSKYLASLSRRAANAVQGLVREGVAVVSARFARRPTPQA